MHGWVNILQDWPLDKLIRRNVAPTTQIMTLREAGIASMRWGLVPRWSKDPTSKYATFNARIEGINEKPSFKSAWQASNTCLIPMGGYYEWRKEGGIKQPYFIHAKDRGPLVMAGLWDEWVDQETGEVSLSCTMITKPSEGALADLHHRMPLIMTPALAKSWLQANIKTAEDIAQQASADDVSFYKVDTKVNNARNEGEELTAPQGKDLLNST